MSSSQTDGPERVLLDLNAAVISMLGDHPGHGHVFPQVERGFQGECRLLLFDYYPFRAQHILTSRYDVERTRARNTVQRFVRQPVEFVSAERETVLDAYEVSAEKDHDVYDSFLIALARTHDADVVLTTDTDFDELCRDEPLQYRNPVPDEVLSQFSEGTDPSGAG